MRFGDRVQVAPGANKNTVADVLMRTQIYYVKIRVEYPRDFSTLFSGLFLSIYFFKEDVQC